MAEEMRYEKFGKIDLDDPFFDSLKESYAEFSDWFGRKRLEDAYIALNEHGKLEGFLYLKAEVGPITDVNPPLELGNWIKVGTLKINAHGTKMGERFLKKIFDHAISIDAYGIYVTVFKKHESLINLFTRHGFVINSEKHTINGSELVLVRRLKNTTNNIYFDYPRFSVSKGKNYLLAIFPEFHTRLLPDSILNNESADIVEDISYTNRIHKIYISFADLSALKPGDKLVMYRTGDGNGPARFRSVATSICVVESVVDKRYFNNEQAFVDYCLSYSVFSEEELRGYFREKSRIYVIKFMYNAALRKRITRGMLIDQIGIDESQRWTFLPLTDRQVESIIDLGNVEKSLVID